MRDDGPPAAGLAGRSLLIRADGTRRTGAGHLLRCLALARAWQGAGGRVEFASQCEGEGLRRRIEEAGARLVALDRPHPDRADLQATLEALGRLAGEAPGAPRPWLALDGYHFDTDYHRAVRSAGYPLLVIDDGARLPVYDADLVVDQNLGAERLDYRGAADTEWLLGTRYVLLRPEFLAREGRRHERRDQVRRVVVTMGGSDPDNVSLRVLDALGRLGPDGPEVRVVVGPSNPHRASLEEAVGRSPGRATLIEPADDMAAVLAWADLAVSAAGVTCWELAYLGVPMALVVIADNQRPSANGLAERGAAVLLGDASSLDPAQVAAELARWIADPARLLETAERARGLVDGGGAPRVVAAMARKTAAANGPGGPTIRRAGAADARRIWEWANDPKVRANSFNPEPIPWESHLRWFESRLLAPGTRFWILEDAGEPVGLIRYDRDDDEPAAEVSFSVADGHRGRGYGTVLVRTTRALALAELGVEEIRAVTFAENEASRRAFLRVGFTTSGQTTIRGRSCYRLTWRPA